MQPVDLVGIGIDVGHDVAGQRNGGELSVQLRLAGFGIVDPAQAGRQPLGFLGSRVAGHTGLRGGACRVEAQLGGGQCGDGLFSGFGGSLENLPGARLLLLDHGKLILRIENLKSLRQCRVAEMRAQQAIAQSMKGAYPHPAGIDRQHGAYAQHHLFSCFISKSDR